MDSYRREGSSLYEYNDGAYFFVYRNDRCNTLKQLIAAYHRELDES